MNASCSTYELDLQRSDASSGAIGECVRAADFTTLVNGDNARMTDAGGGTRLLEEALYELRTKRVLGAQELECSVAAELAVARGIEDPEAALPELAADLVPPDACPTSERHPAPAMIRLALRRKPRLDGSTVGCRPGELRKPVACLLGQL